jgi:DNA-binding MarR family transcriptional regulator
MLAAYGADGTDMNLPAPAVRGLLRERDSLTGMTDRVATTQRAMLELAQLGEAIGEGIESSVGVEYRENSVVIVLFLLSLEGPKRPRAIQRSLHYSSGGTTLLLERMERLGLVSRASGGDATDGRAVVVSLTPKGRRIARRLADAVADAVDGVSGLVRRLAERTPG